jgi:hypothetical protein
MRDRGPGRTRAHKESIGNNPLDRHVQQSARPASAILRSALVNDVNQLPTRFISNINGWDLVNEKFGDGSSKRHATQPRSETPARPQAPVATYDVVYDA